MRVSHFLSKPGHKDLNKHPYLDFSILLVVFAVIKPQELRLSTLLLNYRSLWRTWL